MPRMSGAASAVYFRLQSGLLMRSCSLVLLEAPGLGPPFWRGSHATTIERVLDVLERKGIEFIEGGVRLTRKAR